MTCILQERARLIFSLGKVFADRHLSKRRGATAMDGKFALIYFIVCAVITFLYVDGESFERTKHAIRTLTMTQIESAQNKVYATR